MCRSLVAAIMVTKEKRAVFSSYSGREDMCGLQAIICDNKKQDVMISCYKQGRNATYMILFFEPGHNII
jgi:hypothetical protein